MKMKSKNFLVVFIFCVVFSLSSYAELNDYIVVVKPIFHEKTRENFRKLAEKFKKDNNHHLAWYFMQLAEEHGHGTGWVYVDANGENYIITNRHVVSQAEKVNIYFNSSDGAQVSYNNCPVIYVDDQFDLAVCQFPNKNKKFKVGFETSTLVYNELTEVVAAGYPGFGKEALWQIAKGNISNAKVKIDKNYEYWIQHTAPICINRCKWNFNGCFNVTCA